MVAEKTGLRDDSEIDYKLLLDACNSMEEAMVVYDAKGYLTYCNHAFRDMYGYTLDQTHPGVHFQELGKIDILQGNVVIEDEDGPDYLDRKLTYRQNLMGSFTVKLQDGRWIRTTDRRMANGGFVSVQYDITELKEIESVRHLAYHDDLTGLPTRRLAREKIADALQLARRHHWKFALMFIDLDDFKAVNDIFGHDTGDRLLVQAGTRFSRCLRGTDIVARIGGDEFLVLQTGVKDNHAVIKIAKNLLKAASKPFLIDGQEHHIGASIGICLYPDHGTDMDSLFKNADAAMYKSKETGKNRFSFV